MPRQPEERFSFNTFELDLTIRGIPQRNDIKYWPTRKQLKNDERVIGKRYSLERFSRNPKSRNRESKHSAVQGQGHPQISR